MADNTKAYETYQLLAGLLNSQREEDIDAAYDALKAASEASYGSQIKKTESEYADKRDVAAQNRAKADKYLNYFMTEGGYEGSGIQADAKVKQEIGYNSDLTSLDTAQQQDVTSLRDAQQADALKLDSQRADSKYEAKKDAADEALQVAKLELQQQQLAADNEQTAAENAQWQKENEDSNYWKQKEYELKQIEASASSDKNDTTVQAYRMQLYNSIVAEFERADTLNEMEAIYATISGVNTEQANAVFGESLYTDLISKFNKRISTVRKQTQYNARVNELYDEFVSAKDEHYNTTYLRLYREIVYGNFSPYTVDQLDDALELYKKNAT